MAPKCGSLRLGVALLLLWGFSGCSSGSSDQTVVDFSQTVAVARPARPAGGGSPPLKVAVAAMTSPRETFDLYRQLLDYLGQNLGRELELVQRKTYGEIDEMLLRGEIDLAFICSGPYVTGKERYGFEPLVVPEINGSHFYQSYLIVHKDSPVKKLEDLQGHTFAFTDPDSNTGRLVPTYWLAEAGARPETFFSRIIYTYSHDNSIMAVARGLVDGAAVDGLIWDFYQARNPSFTSRTRVIKKSEPFGIPPLVASRKLAAAEQERIRKVLLGMHQDPEGRRILGELMIDRFIPLREEWYASLRQMTQYLGRMRGEGHALPNP